jgi:hypothetical protein
MPRDILPIIKGTSENLLILGKAGVGKSTLIKVVKRHFGKKCIILCPTGIAAQNVNGVTIHSFFSLPIGDSFSSKEINTCIRYLKTPDKLRRLQEIETIIIDEVSMVNSIVINTIDAILKSIFQTNLPFGGKRLILIGDIFQLPPIDKENKRKDDIFFWRSSAFRAVRFQRMELRKVYRLSDSDQNKSFEKILEKLRIYKTSQIDLDFLNYYFTPAQNINETTILCTRKSDVETYNKQGLEKLSKRIHTFHAEISSRFPKGEFPVIPEFKIAIGAPVIFIRNDAGGMYKNGTRGKVIGIDEKDYKISVLIENQEKVTVGYVEWLPSKNNDKNTIQKIDYFRHFPLLLGFAMTIHRCQGLTMTKVHLDLAQGAFAPGQLYVALSRLKDISGLSLARKLRFDDLIQSQETNRFYNEVNFEEVNLNISGAELSTVDSQNEVVKTVQGNQLDTKSLSIHLFNQGLNVEEILQERIRLGFKEILPKTIISHLIERYEEVDIEELKDLLFISDSLEEEICEELRERNDIENCSLKDIRNSLSNPEIDYDKLKVILYANGFLSPQSPSRNKMKSPFEIPKVEPTSQMDRKLFEILRVLRLEKANEKSVQPFQIFHNSSLEEMAEIKPATRSEFLNIAGVGQLKLEEFGEEFLEAIRGYCGFDPKASDNFSELDSHLFEELKKLRNTLARQRGLPAYCIFNNETLKEMATVKPITKTQFLKIGGIGEIKLNDFGDSFISCVKENI